MRRFFSAAKQHTRKQGVWVNSASELFFPPTFGKRRRQKKKLPMPPTLRSGRTYSIARRVPINSVTVTVTERLVLRRPSWALPLPTNTQLRTYRRRGVPLPVEPIDTSSSSSESESESETEATVEDEESSQSFFVPEDVVPAQNQDPSERLGGRWEYCAFDGKYRLVAPCSPLQILSIQLALAEKRDAPLPAPSAQQQVAAETEDEPSQTLPRCLCCVSRNCDVVFTSCGHVVVCSSCVDKLKQNLEWTEYENKLVECPLCRTMGPVVFLKI